MKKTSFIMIVAVILGLYGVANVMLYCKKAGFYYFETDLFFGMTSIFFLLLILILPRTLEIMLGFEPQANEVN